MTQVVAFRLLAHALQSGVGMRAVSHAVFAQDDGNAPVHEARLHLRKLADVVILLVTFVHRPVLAVRLAPEVRARRRVFVEGEVVGIVVHLYHEAGRSRVFRQFHPAVSIVDVRAGSLHDEVAPLVVAARGTHGIHESLLVTRQHVHIVAVCHRRLVGAGKEQAAVVVAEVRGNLRPEVIHLGLRSLDVCLRRQGSITLVVHPAAVPVDIEDGIHAGVHAIIHHLRHAGHP